MASDTLIPDTRVLAIASHVVHGYVGNKMATFVMQSLGCDVSAINTVHYSNHLAYKQVKGTKTSAEEIIDLYEGLRQSHLTDFDVLLTGYMPSAEAVRAIGKIGRDVKFNAGTKPGSFFWVLDPVMGDNGKLYIPEDEVPEYKALLREADLILPNQFEAELLSGIPITDLESLAAAIQVLHKTFQVPHVIITSLRLTRDNHTISSRAPSKPASTTGSGTHTPSESQPRDAAKSHLSAWPVSNNSEEPKAPQINLDEVEDLTVIGSTATSDFTPRLFRIDTPQLPLFFSGTGDMFAALTVPRFIEAVRATNELSSRPSWRSPDDVPAEELPLAKSCQKVLASMQAILSKTTQACHDIMEAYDARAERDGCGQADEVDEETRKKRHLALMNASEVKVVRHVKELIDPPNLDTFKPRPIEEGNSVPSDVGQKRPDALKVLHLGASTEDEGMIQVVNGKSPGSESKHVETSGGELNDSGLKKIEPNILESKEAQSVKEAHKDGES